MDSQTATTTTTPPAAATTSRRSLTMLTWNIAMLEPSYSAGPSWTQSHALSEIDSLAKEFHPHIIHIQESPYPTSPAAASNEEQSETTTSSSCFSRPKYLKPGDFTFIDKHYQPLPQTTMSHCGYICTFVANHIYEEIVRVELLQSFAVVVHWKFSGLTTANVHLAPHSKNVDFRRQQAGEIFSTASRPDNLVVLGDTNMRAAEEDTWKDKLKLEPKGGTPITWDTFRNKYHACGDEKQVSYTRLMCGSGVAVTRTEVLDRTVQCDGKEFFVSDHFALLVELSVPS